ncbi:UNVERIFIED_CONTAM: hypothetical protein Scaly_3004900 [Sesamum calycinum]|uniref:Retrotransposon Copia-like N-terminal domain-containing protein n=1 Tax=Sesamum calycinum TaxID=2727403 RepID=A0AAW2KG28_9LAMI
MELGEAAMVETTTSPKHQVHADCLQLQDSDHPTMILVTTPFNGGNYLIWSRLIRICLGAKMKLGFIDGKIPNLRRIPMNLANGIEWIVWSGVGYLILCQRISSNRLYTLTRPWSYGWSLKEGSVNVAGYCCINFREIFTISQGNSLFWPILQRLRDYGTNSHASCPYRTAPTALLRLWRN